MSNKIIFTEEQIEDIINRYKNNESIRSVSYKYKCRWEIIDKILKENNIEKRPYKIFNKKDIPKITKRYKKGESLFDIVKEYNASREGLNKFLRKNNFKFDYSSKRMRKYTLNEHYLDKIDTQEKAYFLGFMYADGNVEKKGNTISINLHEKDKDILFKFKKLFSSERPIARIKKQKQYKFIINSRYLKQKFIGYGCVPAKTEILTYPEFISPELENHFVRGYFDGDGCFYCGAIKNKKCKTIGVSIMSSKYFCLSLIKRLKKRGIKGHLDKNLWDNGNVGRVFIDGKYNIIKFMDWIYSNNAMIYLERKHNKYIKFREWYYNYIQDLDKYHLYHKKKYENYLKTSFFSFTN